MARHGYRDGKAWIQRRQGVAIEKSYSWVCIFFLNLIQSVDTATARRGYRDSQAWIQRQPGMDIATA